MLGQRQHIRVGGCYDQYNRVRGLGDAITKTRRFKGMLRQEGLREC
jgi:hypothetical protein